MPKTAAERFKRIMDGVKKGQEDILEIELSEEEKRILRRRMREELNHE